MADSAAKRTEAALRAATGPLSLEQLAAAVFGRRGDFRDRAALQVILHRLDARGLLVKHPRTYSIKSSAAMAAGD